MFCLSKVWKALRQPLLGKIPIPTAKAPQLGDGSQHVSRRAGAGPRVKETLFMTLGKEASGSCIQGTIRAGQEPLQGRLTIEGREIRLWLQQGKVGTESQGAWPGWGWGWPVDAKLPRGTIRDGEVLRNRPARNLLGRWRGDPSSWLH